jgi:hypothetical protein
VNDIELYEGGNGGELRLNGNDLNWVDGISNMPYMSCFGGNDWWGNDLLDEGRGIRFTAETEDIINSTPLSSNGRLKIEQAIIRDLQYLKAEFPTEKLIVSVSIVSEKRIDITVNLAGKEMFLVWNPFIPEAVRTLVEPPYAVIWESPIRSGLSSRYAMTGFTLTQGIDTAVFDIAKFATMSDEMSLIAYYNSIAAGFGMTGLFQIQGYNIVYLLGYGETWAVTTAAQVLHWATEMRLKVATSSALPTTWSYVIGGTDAYSIVDWGDGSAIEMTITPSLTTPVVHIYANSLENKQVVIYTNDAQVNTLRLQNTTSNYLFRRFVTRAPLSLTTLIVSQQQIGLTSDFIITDLAQLNYISLQLNQITGFSPALFLGNHPNLTIIDVSDNRLSSAQVDDIFNYLYANSPEILLTTGTIDTSTQTPSAPPTAASLTARNAFTAAGWTLITD